MVTEYRTHNVHLDRCILVCMLLGKNVSQRCVIFFHLNIKDYLSTQNEVAVNVCKKKKKKKKTRKKLMWKFEGNCLWYILLHWMKFKTILYQSLPNVPFLYPIGFLWNSGLKWVKIYNNKNVHLEYTRELFLSTLQWLRATVVCRLKFYHERKS